jgi:hypothetical protein
MVIDNRLRFSVVTQLGESITQTISTSLQQHLQALISHCINIIALGNQSYTPSDFNIDISQSLLDQLQAVAKHDNNEIESIYPANSLQQGFIYYALSQPQDDAYRVQILFDYKQPLDIAHYLKAWELVIATYPILRTAFNWEESLIQIQYKYGKLNHYYHDLSHLTAVEQEQTLHDIQQSDRQVGFNLQRAELLRLHIIKHSDAHYTIIKTEHHSISDGWSGPILLNKVH